MFSRTVSLLLQTSSNALTGKLQELEAERAEIARLLVELEQGHSKRSFHKRKCERPSAIFYLFCTVAKSDTHTFKVVCAPYGSLLILYYLSISSAYDTFGFL